MKIIDAADVYLSQNLLRILFLTILFYNCYKLDQQNAHTLFSVLI